MTARELRERSAGSRDQMNHYRVEADGTHTPMMSITCDQAQALADLIEYADDAVRFEHSPSHMGALADALTALGADR